MFCRARAIQRFRLPHLASTSSTPTRQHLARQCLRPSSPNVVALPPLRFPAYGFRSLHHRSAGNFQPLQHSGSTLNAGLLVIGIAIGAALLYPFSKSSAEKTPTTTFADELPADFDISYITDSYLIMAPNVPPGRPGTLTPEQEVKLRELWAATLKVFGVYEAPSASEANGAEKPVAAPASESSEKEGKKEKDKKKSRLNVFKRHKDDKEDKSESAPSSGTSTPVDISQMSIAEEDDKHGQTKDFRAALANLAPEDLRKAFWSMVKLDHPDGLLLRFLRARKWDVEKALVMMISTMHWRLEEMHVDDDVVRQGELFAFEQSQSDDAKAKKDGEDFLAALRMGKSFLHGLDKDGRPLCFVRVRLHKQGEQSEESIERFTVYTIETARMLLRSPVDTATIVFDMTNFSMANMDYAPVKFMIKCFEANYPESLGAILVYKAPWIFNTIWSIIRGWLDPVVAGKVHFCKTVEELEAFVPKNQIPTECGGDEKWEYTYPEPVPGENDIMKDVAAKEAIQSSRSELVKKYESTILQWIHEGDAQSKSLEERRTERNNIAEELRVNYWTLDPYVRARSLYDRIGVISPGGKLDFYPSEKKAAAAPVAAAPTQETSPDDLD